MRKRASSKALGDHLRDPSQVDAPSCYTFELDGEVYAVLSIPTSKERVGDDLTPAEQEVLELLLEGQSNAGIAVQRKTSVRTVANQVASLFRKLGVSSRRELVALCVSQEESTRHSTLTK